MYPCPLDTKKNPVMITKTPLLSQLCALCFRCVLIGYNCVFQGQCTLISTSIEKPEATKANVHHLTKAKYLSQRCIMRGWFSVKHCPELIVCLAYRTCHFKAATFNNGNCFYPADNMRT